MSVQRVAMLSVHTSPLAQPGAGDGGGMNVYVRSLASNLARAGGAWAVLPRPDHAQPPPAGAGEKHRSTTSISCHLGNQGHDLAALGQALDRNPNLFLDISARDYEV